MTWFWLLGQIILAGAVVNLVLHPEIERRKPERPPHVETSRLAA